jgi:fructose-bisphosphate aldolase class II
MFDGSRLPIKQNIKLTSAIVKIAHKANVSVEGEIGFVGYNKGKMSIGTKIEEVELFAKESGADAIAISVGNQHLQTKKIAKIDISKIRAIENVTNSPLVLHGGSGIPANIRKKLARNHNIAKFNIGTELRMLFGNTIRKNILINKRSYDRIELLKPTIKETKKLTKKIISNIGPLV